MANITNLFVRVKQNRVDDFLKKHYSKYTGEGKASPRDTSYDNKIVFLENWGNETGATQTGQIFTKDALFSVSAIDFDALKARAKALEDKVGTESVISQIQTEIAKLDGISYSYAGTDNFIRTVTQTDGVVTTTSGTLTLAALGASGDYAAVYQLQINGQKVGENINIPKDLLVQDAFTHKFASAVAKDATFTATGKQEYTIKASQAYVAGDIIIVLVINTATSGTFTFLQIKVTDLVNSYKADETTITLDTTTNTFSVKAGGIGSTQLDSDTNTYLNKISIIDGDVSTEGSFRKGDVDTLASAKAYTTEEIGKLDLTAVTYADGFISTVSQTDGKVAASYSEFATSVTETGGIAPKASAVWSYTGSNIAILRTEITTAQANAYAYTSSVVDALDLTETGEDGKYIKKAKQENGKVSVTLESFDTTISITSTDNNAPTSKAVVSYVAGAIAGVKAAVDNLNGTYTVSDGQFISTVKQEKGQVSATYTDFASSVTSDGAIAPKASAVYTYVGGAYVGLVAGINQALKDAKTYTSNIVDALDATITVSTGYAFTSITQTDGKISAYTEAKIPEYTITKDTSSTTYTSVYHLTKDGTEIGEAINIPKDMVVKAAAVIDYNGTDTKITIGGVEYDVEGTHAKGKYIVMIVSNAASGASQLWLDVKDLVDVYTIQEGSKKYLNIDSNNAIGAYVDVTDGLSSYAWSNAVYAYAGEAYTYSKTEIANINTAYTNLKTYVTNVVAKKADDAYAYAGEAYTYSKVEVARIDLAYTDLKTYVTNVVAKKADDAYTFAGDAYTYATNIGYALDDLSTKVSGVSYSVTSYNSYNIAITYLTTGSKTEFKVNAVVKNLDNVNLAGSDNQGLATAYNVAYNIIVNEKVTAAALNDLNKRLLPLETGQAAYAYSYASIAYEYAKSAYAYAESAYTYAGQVGAVADKKVASIAYSSNCSLSVTYTGTAYTVTLNSETVINTASTDNDSKLANIGAIKSYVSTTYNAALDIAKAQLSYVYAATVSTAQSTYTSGYVTTKVAAVGGTAGSHTQDICVDLTMGSFGYTSGVGYSVTTEGLMTAYQISEMFSVLSAWEEY